MPITPRFKLSQSEIQLTITIRIPHIRVSASTLEIIVDESDFHFYSSPYLLHLSFPNGRLLDDAETSREAKATYDPSDQNGTLTVVIWKEEEGIWPDLDLLSNLVCRSPAPVELGLNAEAKISVIASETNGEVEEEEEASKAAEGYNINIEGHGANMDLKVCLKPHYGFLNMHHSVFTDYAREGLSYDMLEIPSPDDTPSDNRRDLRLDVETDKFDSERYLADLFLSDDPNDECADMIYVEAVRFLPHWAKKDSVDDLIGQMEQMNTKSTTRASSSLSSQGNFFTEDESQRLLSTKSQLPLISKINKEQTKSIFYSLVDILYAYVYDHRTTMGDCTCESSWTVVTLSPTLSWLESYTPPYDTITHVLRWSIRRALIYPYLRTFDFVAGLLVKDVIDIFRGGRRIILRCLLQIQQIMDGSEFHYLFNKLYINPYICWIQQISEDDLVSFVEDDLIPSVNMRKNDDAKSQGDASCLLDKSSLGLDLDILEKCNFEGEGEGEDASSSSSSDTEDDDDDADSDSSVEDTSEDNHCSSLNDETQLNEQNGSLLAMEQKNSSNNLLDNQIGSGNILSLDSNALLGGREEDAKAVTDRNGETKKCLITEIG